MLEIIQEIIKPLSDPAIFLAALVAGLVLGRIYNRAQGIAPSFIFHKAVTGWVFLFTIFIFRGVETGSFNGVFGWLGIALLWGFFCACIYIGDRFL